MARPMSCPECATSLTPLSCGTAVVDRCGACAGIWFDDREIGQFREGLQQRELDRLGVPTAPRAASAKRSYSGCARCAGRLQEGEYAYGTGLRIARCTSCEGCWLPGTEVPRFIEHVRVSKAKEGELREIAGDVAAGSRARTERHSPMNYSSLGTPLARWYLMPRIILPLSAEATAGAGFPFVTTALIAAFMAVAFLVPEDVVRAWALVPATAFTAGGLTTFLTSGFVHSGWLHLLGNAGFLWLFGGGVEGALGRTRFLALYFVGEIAADLVHVVVSLGSTVPCIGASGAISAILGAYLALYPASTIKTYVWGELFSIPAWGYLGGWFFVQLVSGAVEALAGTSSGVAWCAHLGGFAAGFALGLREAKRAGLR